MATLKGAAEAYEPKKTKNIVELARVPVDVEIESKTFNEGSDDEFTIDVINVDGLEYRVPSSVLKNLKALVIEMPDLKAIKVTKSGEGLNTSYTVIPLVN